MLTDKELHILSLKKQGLKQIDISKRLKISQPAVSQLYTNALRKIQDAQLVLAKAEELGYD